MSSIQINSGEAAACRSGTSRGPSISWDGEEGDGEEWYTWLIPLSLSLFLKATDQTGGGGIVGIFLGSSSYSKLGRKPGDQEERVISQVAGLR